MNLFLVHRPVCYYRVSVYLQATSKHWHKPVMWNFCCSRAPLAICLYTSMLLRGLFVHYQCINLDPLAAVQLLYGYLRHRDCLGPTTRNKFTTYFWPAIWFDVGTIQHLEHQPQHLIVLDDGSWRQQSVRNVFLVVEALMWAGSLCIIQFENLINLLLSSSKYFGYSTVLQNLLAIGLVLL